MPETPWKLNSSHIKMDKYGVPRGRMADWEELKPYIWFLICTEGWQEFETHKNEAGGTGDKKHNEGAN